MYQAAFAKEDSENVHQDPPDRFAQVPPQLRVLHLPHAVTARELEVELDEQNPGLLRLFAADPRMLRPRVALLSFNPGAVIPSRVVAFTWCQKPALFMAGRG